MILLLSLLVQLSGNEPMICIYGEFGVRLEDHVYMTEEGPIWFTQPSFSIDQPFGKY